MIKREYSFHVPQSVIDAEPISLTQDEIFMLNYSRNVLSACLDHLTLIDVQINDKSKDEMLSLYYSLQQEFFKVWENQKRTKEEVHELIRKQFRIAKELFCEVESYMLNHLDELNNTKV